MLLQSVGLQVVAMSSTVGFLAGKRTAAPSCLILDVRLPGDEWPRFSNGAAKAQIDPIIFITGHGDIPMTVQAMKAGAVEFQTRPFRGQDLLDAFASSWNAIVRVANFRCKCSPCDLDTARSAIASDKS